jgi:hypothetical protein
MDTIQALCHEIAFWNQKNDSAISLSALNKLIKRLDSFNKKSLSLGEFHSVKALYEEASSFAKKLQSCPPSAKYIPSIQKLLSKIPDIVHLSSEEQIQKIQRSQADMKTIACLSALKNTPFSLKKAQAIVKKIPIANIKEKMLKELFSSKTVDVQKLLFVAKEDIRLESRFFQFRETDVKKRSWKQIFGYFNPETTLTSYSAQKHLKKKEKHFPIKQREFIPLKNYSLQKRLDLGKYCQEAKEALIKQSMQKLQIDTRLFPLLCKHCSLQNLAQIKNSLLQLQKDIPANEQKILSLLKKTP